MSNTSAKCIPQIKSVFLRLNLIHVDTVGYVIKHVKKF